MKLALHFSLSTTALGHLHHRCHLHRPLHRHVHPDTTSSITIACTPNAITTNTPPLLSHFTSSTAATIHTTTINCCPHHHLHHCYPLQPPPPPPPPYYCTTNNHRAAANPLPKPLPSPTLSHHTITKIALRLNAP
ncbi:hypothetical protein AMTRI_Chr08g164960 [Amborella trichopoda]